MTIEIETYNETYKNAWDEFVSNSKNGVFLFYRDYMEYHSDRFQDHSLLFFTNGKLIAILPANLNKDALISHGGLTFGGMITNQKMKTPVMLDLFDALIAYLKIIGAQKLLYKSIPHIYSQIPSEEDLYALHVKRARLYRRDVSSSIRMDIMSRFSKGRKSQIARAKKSGLTIRQSNDFEAFMAIEENVLIEKYDTRPVHTAQELRYLTEKFPANIKLYCAYKKNEMLAGVIIYESRFVAHAQYIAATTEGQDLGATDLILSYLIRSEFVQKKYFDFGISTEKDGYHLNHGLIKNKESFGARAVVYDFYELIISETI